MCLRQITAEYVDTWGYYFYSCHDFDFGGKSARQSKPDHTRLLLHSPFLGYYSMKFHCQNLCISFRRQKSHISLSGLEIHQWRSPVLVTAPHPAPRPVPLCSPCYQWWDKKSESLLSWCPPVELLQIPSTCLHCLQTAMCWQLLSPRTFSKLPHLNAPCTPGVLEHYQEKRDLWGLFIQICVV